MGNNAVGNSCSNVARISLIIFFLLTGSAALFAQTAEKPERKSFAASNVTVQQLVDQLGVDFKYSFFIVDEQVRKVIVSVDKKEATLDEILKQAFNQKGIAYHIKDRRVTIALQKARAAENNTREPTQVTVSGVVMDSRQQPIAGASIYVRETRVGAVSDTEGRFSIQAPANGGILVISYIGYHTQEVELTGLPSYHIVLADDHKIIEEVVAIGYGTQKRGNLTGSISSVDTEKLTVAPITNVTNALAGQLPGLRTKQSSGIPGSDGSRLSIRGFNSPLVIVDGVETSFSNIDASQIESISILKDGAASIYGARAGNGVVLVTLKRGRVSKVSVTANASQTMQNSTRLIRSGSSGQRAEWEREEHINANLPASQMPWALSEIQEFYSGTNPDYLNSDWFSAAIRDWAPQQNHNVSVSGGNEKIKFYSYFGYNDQTTISRHDGGGYKRFNTQATVDAEIVQGLTLSSSFNYINENRDFTAMGLGSSNYYYALYDSDPRYPLALPDPTMLPYAGSTYGNAVFVSSRKLAGYNRNANHNLRLNSALTYDVKGVEGLSVKAFLNYNGYFGLGKIFRTQPDFYSYNAAADIYTFERKSQDPTLMSLSSSYSDDLTQQYSVSYENILDQDHRVSVLALHERIDYNSEGFNTQRGNLTSSVIDQLFVGDPTSASNDGSASEMGRSSFVGRLNYGYKNRYLVETIFRADASAKFPKEGRWGFFPSVSLGWVVSEEDFLEGSAFIDHLKLRGSMGQSGDDGIGNYQYYAGYAYDMSYILGNTIYQGLFSTGLANAQLSWERLSIYNLGVDFSMFNRKVYGTVEGFYRLRDGIPGYRVQSLPSSFGAALPLENLNSIDTRGFELEVGTIGQVGELSYDISANISWARSKWVMFDEPDYEDADQDRIFRNTGKWTDERYGYLADGLFTSEEEIRSLPYTYIDLGGNDGIRPGDVKYLDVNEDGRLDWRDQVSIGQGTVPNWMGGLNMSFKYRNFELSGLFQGGFGYTTYIDLESAPTTLKYEHRWTSEENDPNAYVPRPGSKNVANWWYSDYRNHNSAYVRLKNLSVGYQLTGRVLETMKLSNVRLYLAGMNLFTVSTLSKYGVDPEAPEGTPAYYYPQQRTVSVGLSLSY